MLNGYQYDILKLKPYNVALNRQYRRQNREVKRQRYGIVIQWGMCYNFSIFDSSKLKLTEDGHFTASVEKMEGMDTIWVLDAEKDAALDITYTLNVFSGKMKLVLINSKGEISIIAECDTEMTEPVQSMLNIVKGNNRIKIVADENTKFDIDVSISEGDFQNLGMASRS